MKRFLHAAMLFSLVFLIAFIAKANSFDNTENTSFILLDNKERAVNWDNVKEALLLLKTPEEKDLYGQCRFIKNTNDINLSSCKLALAKPIKNADVEHVVPASMLPAASCSIDKDKREACSGDPTYKEAYHNLHNLYYTQANLNRSKGDLLFCEHGLKNKQPSGFAVGEDCVVPPDAAKGIVARATLYMSDTYKMELSAPYERLMRKWDKLYPVTEEERERAAKANKMQPKVKCNSFVVLSCK